MAAAVGDTAVFSGLLKRRKWAKGTELSRPRRIARKWASFHVEQLASYQVFSLESKFTRFLENSPDRRDGDGKDWLSRYGRLVSDDSSTSVQRTFH